MRRSVATGPAWKDWRARSRDEGGMTRSGCLRERLDEATYVPLALWAGGV